jgi:hypothetical protein
MAKEYNISKTAGRCLKCNTALSPGQEFVATLKETAEEFCREDYCTSCWQEPEALPPEIVGVWHSHVPQPQEKKRLFVDNDLLVNFFQRLEDAQEPLKINFRYVLALVLMRKKLLIYDGRNQLPDGREIWKMHFKASDQVQKVIDPGMDEEKIAQTSEHLGDILEGEL